MAGGGVVTGGGDRGGGMFIGKGGGGAWLEGPDETTRVLDEVALDACESSNGETSDGFAKGSGAVNVSSEFERERVGDGEGLAFMSVNGTVSMWSWDARAVCVPR